MTFNKFQSAEESPGFLLWQVSMRWRKCIEAALKPFDLTHPQFVVLATLGWLTRKGEKISQIEIGRCAAIDPNTLSQILRGVEAKGWIVRSTCANQKRPVLTLKGQNVLSKALPAVEESDALFFAAAGKELIPALQTLQKAHTEP